MRFLLLFVPVVLAAQSSAPASKPSPAKPAAAKPAATKSVTTTPKADAPPALVTDQDKILYALGLSISRSLSQFNLSPQELTLVQRGISDGSAGKPAEELTVWGPKISGLAQQRAAQVAAHEKEVSTEYLAKAAAAPGAVKTPSGLIYREISPGAGASPKASDTVKVNYRGTLVDGTEFDSSYKRNQPAEFPLGNVIPCWTEGLQKMKVGGKAQLVCPSAIAYGEQGRPGIPGNATLIFDIELLDVQGQPAAPAAPGAPQGH